MLFRAKIATVLMTLVLGTIGAAAVTPTTAHAANLTCSQIEFLGALFDTRLEAELDTRVAGEEYRISRRKQLRINGIKDVTVNGCNITVVADVTLKRKIRRDADGTVTMKGKIAVNSLGNDKFELRFTDIEVTDVSLSHTLGIGEAAYGWVANLVLPDSGTVIVEL